MNLYRVIYDSGSYFVEAPSFGKAIETWQAWAAKNWEDDGWEGTEQPESVELIDSEHRVIRIEGPSVYECPCVKNERPCVCAMTAMAPKVGAGDQIRVAHDNWKDVWVVVERTEGRLGRDFRAAPVDGRMSANSGRLGPNGTLIKVPLALGFCDYEEGRRWHRAGQQPPPLSPPLPTDVDHLMRPAIGSAPELDDERRVVQTPANRQNWVARAFF